MSRHNIPFLNIRKKIILNKPKSVTMGFGPRTQERVRNSRGKRAISVRAIEVLPYIRELSSLLIFTFVSVKSLTKLLIKSLKLKQ